MSSETLEAQAMKSMLDAGMSEDAARELLGMARTAGMTMDGAGAIVVTRQGPARWLVEGDGGREPIEFDTPRGVLLEVAKRMHGGSHDVTSVEITYARDRLASGRNRPSEGGTQ